MIESEQKTEQAAEIQDPTTPEKRPEKELIDRLAEYVPDINTIKHREVAERLVEQVETATKELEEETELARLKLVFLQTLETETRLLARSKKENGRFDFEEDIEETISLFEIYESENPYETLLSKFPADRLIELADGNQELCTYQSEFGKTKQMVSLVWRKSEHERKIRLAQKLAREIVKGKIEKYISEIVGRIKTARDELSKPENDLANLWKQYCSADPENQTAAAQALKKALDFNLSANENLGALEGLDEFAEASKSRGQGEFEWSVGRISSATSDYKKTSDSILYLFDKEKGITSATSGLKRRAESLKNGISAIFEERRPDRDVPDFHERENWSITKEFLQAIKNFNAQVRKTERVAGTNIGEYKNYYFSQIQEAERISSGRLLTHAAPTAMMYQILERGDVSSIAEQEKKHKTTHRTHRNARFEDKETHDICFNVDSVYGSFSTNESWISGGSRIRADMVLTFSENHILDRNQFVDMDGRHVFDKNYSGDTEESPGFSIDLLKTPFVILVSESEKDKLTKFLKEKSVFKSQLEQLDPQKLESWLDNHLITTPDIDGFKFTSEIKNRFFQANNLKPQKGYVELTDTVAEFKIGPEKTKQFFATAA